MVNTEKVTGGSKKVEKTLPAGSDLQDELNRIKRLLAAEKAETKALREEIDFRNTQKPKTAEIDGDGFIEWLLKQDRKKHRTNAQFFQYIQDRKMYFLVRQFIDLYRAYSA